MKVETDMPTFQRLTKCLAEIYPQATVELLASDPALRDWDLYMKSPVRSRFMLHKNKSTK